MVRPLPCPSPEQLRGLLVGDLADDDQAQWTRHLDHCAGCQQALEDLAADGHTWPGAGRRFSPEAGAATALRRAMDRLKGAAEGDPDGKEFALDFLQPSERPDSLGRLGSYEVTEVVGRGGMGVVLKGFDVSLHRVVAIKVLAPQLATSATARRRFEREARATAAVNHEHVVAVHQVAEAGGFPYLVMEYVPGASLQERLDRQGPLALPEILRIGLQAARGLAAAHAQGLIHRDVKPANILLENGVERVKLTDFGLARAADDASLTQSGTLAGTPQYMAPEQARGEAIDPRADLFSLGSVLYTLATGRPPFRAATTMAVLRRVSEEAPRPLRDLNPDIPEWFAAIVRRLHAKDPGQRFPSATEVADVLSQHLAHVQEPNLVPLPPASRAQPTGRRGVRWAVAALVLLAAGLGVAEATGQTGLAQYVATVLRIRTPEGTLVVEVEDPQVQVIIDEDSKEIVVAGAGLHEVRLKPGRHRVQATKDGKPVHSEIVTITRGDKRVVRLSLEAEAKAEAAPPARAASSEQLQRNLAAQELLLKQLQEQNQTLAQARDAALAAYGLAKLQAAPLTPKATLVASSGEVYSLAFSPDGKYLAASGEDKAVRVWDSATGKQVHHLQGHAGAVRSVTFTPDGMSLVSGSADGTVRVWDAASGKVQKTLQAGKITIWEVAVAPNGELLTTTGDDHKIRFWDLLLTNQPEQSIPFRGGSRLSQAFTPDGRVLLVGSGWDRVAAVDLRSSSWLWVFPFASDNDPNLKVGTVPPNPAVVRVSPDNQLVAVSKRHGLAFLDRTTGKLVFDWVVPSGVAVDSLAFSPDGKYLAAGESDGTVRFLEVATRQEVKCFAAQKSRILALAFSPDGKTLATGSGEQVVRLWDLSSLRSPPTLPGLSTSRSTPTPRFRLQLPGEGGKPSLRVSAAMGSTQLAELADLLKRNVTSGQTVIDLEVDPSVPYGTVVRVQEVLKSAGVREVQFRSPGAEPPRLPKQ